MEILTIASEYMIHTLLHLSDTHGLHRQLHTLPDADVLVHSGDFTLAGTEKEVFDFIEWLAELPYSHKIFIAGNHDDCLYQAQLEGLPEHIHYLCNSGIEIEGLHFYGVPMFVGDELTGAYEQHIRQIPLGSDVIITHQPPLGIRDYSESIHWEIMPCSNKSPELGLVFIFLVMYTMRVAWKK